MRFLLLGILIAGVLGQETPQVTFDGERAYVNGKPCRCVPQYLCNENLEIVRERERLYTGIGAYDTRFGDEGCMNSLERCCTEPEEETTTTDSSAPRSGCGFRNPGGLDPNSGVGNAKESRFGEFPWAVAVTRRTGAAVGAGALIHPQVVVTAGRVVNAFSPNELVVRAGEDTESTREPQRHQERIVQEIYLHEEFSTSSSVNDVALLHLRRQFDLRRHINVVCLPAAQDVFETNSCVVNSWGSGATPFSSTMKKYTVDMVTTSACSRRLSLARRRLLPQAEDFQLHEGVTCAEGDGNSCDYDSGAPLACPIGVDRYKLTGLVSGSILCRLGDIPGIFVSAPSFRSWVDNKMTLWGYDISTYSA